MYRTLALFLGLSLLHACQNKTNETGTNETEKPKFCLNAEFKKSIEITTISAQAIREELLLSGKIDYNENDLVAFKSLLSGIVAKVHFELGDYVHKDQVLALVKSNTIQELFQHKRTHQNQIALLKSQLKTKKSLLANGLTSMPDMLATEHELEGAEIELAKISASLKLYRAVGDNQFQLLAPKNGYIVQKRISVGQAISTDNEEPALFSISNLKQVWAMVNIYANNLPYIKIGDQADVRTIAYPDRLYTGKIDKIYNIFDNDEHVIKARVVLDNQDLNLMPGLSADIVIHKKSPTKKAFAIPNAAKIFENNKEYVLLYRSDCDLEIKEITAISNNDEYTYVDENFETNAKVISKNALLLYEQLNQK